MAIRCATCGREVIHAAQELGYCPSCGTAVGAERAPASSAAIAPPIVDAPPFVPAVSRPIDPYAMPAALTSAPFLTPDSGESEHLAMASPPAELAPPSMPTLPGLPPPRRRGNAGLAVGIVLVLLAIASGGALYIANNRNLGPLSSITPPIAQATATSMPTATATPLPPTPTPAPTVPPAPTGFTTFTSGDGSYGMNVPTAWTHKNTNGSDAVMDSFASTATNEYVLCTESATTITPDSIATYLQNFVTGYNGGGFHITKSASSVTIGPNTWETAQGSFQSGGQGQSVVGYAINQNGHGYILIYAAPVTSFNTGNGSDFNQIVTSFTFLQ